MICRINHSWPNYLNLWRMSHLEVKALDFSLLCFPWTGSLKNYSLFTCYSQMILNIYIHIHNLRLHLGHWNVLDRGQIVAAAATYATAMATLDLSCICDLCHSLWQCWILKPLSEARDWTCILTDNIGSLTNWATMGTPTLIQFNEMVHTNIKYE